MKILILVVIIALTATDAAEGCDFDPQEACDHCPWDRSWVQFVADDCNCTIFYMCEKTSSGVIIPHEQHCNPCFCFSNDTWSCSIRIKDDPCPPFLTVATDPPPTITPPSKDFFCVDFDKDYRERAYYNVESSCQIIDATLQYSPDDIYGKGLSIDGKALLSAGTPCNVEIPYFQNNQFNQFTFCGMFTYFNRIPAAEMGLIFNGYEDDCFPGSIKIVLNADRTVTAGIVTSGGTSKITSNIAVAASVPHKVCFRYDGKKSPSSLELVVDGQVKRQTLASGFNGLTIRKKCNMRLGESLASLPGSGYQHNPFVGILDTWCFSPKIVSESFFI